MTYRDGVRVAAVQLASGLDPAGNRRLASEGVAAAADAGAELVVLPEATMCAFGDAGFDLAAVAESLDGPFVECLHQAAGRHQVTVVAGMFERSAKPKRAYNTAVAVGPGGLLAAYRKIHLYDALGARESDRIVAGDPEKEVVTFRLGQWHVGLMTCYDLRFPELARALCEAGAEVLCLPAHWYSGPGKGAVWETLVGARAIENTAYVIAAGTPMPDAVGRSRVVDPAGAVLADLPDTGTGCAVADLSPSRLAEVRASLPLLEHRRFRVEPGR
jgi:deaminated glutathione amidase